MISSSPFLSQVRRLRSAALACAALAAPLVASEARAGIADCGNINVEAQATCEVEVEGGCEAKCTPVSFEAQCAGECQADCDKLPEVSCTGSCEADCQAECDVDPPAFECQGTCEADCDGSCDAKCASDADSAECKGRCQATCKAECSGSCEGTPGTATCEGKCKAKCQGECKADLNMDCSLECHGTCSTRLEGGCKARCTQPEGALFCDGQYVDEDSHGQKCLDALKEIVAKVDVTARGSAEGSCSGSTCSASAEGEASCKCSVPGRRSTTGGAGMYAGAGLASLFALAAMARRKRH